MTNTDAMREAFEAWELTAGNATPNIRCNLKGFEHEYACTAKQDRWEAWQASRAQPIVLPASLWHDGKEEYVITRDATVAAITAQGYPVKESE